MKTWITKDGKEIEFNKLEDSHLLNILKFIKKRAKDGVEIVSSYGYEDDNDFMTGDVDVIYGKEVEDKMGYKELKKIAIERKLIK